MIYTTPEGEVRLRDMRAKWVRFLHHQTKLDPLIRIAAGHCRFEATHPFTDGNGRTGRVIDILYLIQEDLLHLPILYLSPVPEPPSDRAQGGLPRPAYGATRDQACEPWLQLMVLSVAETSRWTTAKIVAIRKLAEHTTEHVRAAARDPRARTGGRELRAVALAHRQPGGLGARPETGGIPLPA